MRANSMNAASMGLAGPRPTGAKLELIQATIAVIAEHGLSGLTSARVAAMAGHTAAVVNFHFGGKEPLLLATLRHVSDEFTEAIALALAEAGGDPARALLAVADVSLSPAISEARKVAVWYAFLGESRAREDYQRICGERDAAYESIVRNLCEQVASACEADPRPDAAACALGFIGLLDQLWQDILFAGDEFERDAAKQCARAYLASAFPWLREQLGVGEPPRADSRTAPGPDAGSDQPAQTLPAWVYASDEFFELEREHVLLPGWQVVCHVSELERAGDYVTFEFLGERALVLRDDRGAVRAFHNVCAHRAHALVDGTAGHCGKFLTCPYHGWTYHLDGRNRSVSAPDSFPRFDRSAFGLKPLDVESFLGFVFVRFRPGGFSVAERLHAYRAELEHYRIEDMQPLDEGWEEVHEIDWKNVIENYVEDYHFPTSHLGLSALMESDYDRQVGAHGTIRLSHRMRAEPLPNWSAERYAALLPEQRHLPEDLRRRWSYFGLFPNVFFDVYPEWIDYFHVVPLGPGRVRLRSRSYGRPDGRREMRLARYLSVRINRQVQNEDNALTRSVQGGFASSAYTAGVLSEREVVVKGFQDWIRERLPVARLLKPPVRGMLAMHNRALGPEPAAGSFRPRADTRRSRAR